MSMISVALCTCNGANHLREQLDSLARQTLLPAELQIGDDRSTDSTLAIIEEFARDAPFPVHVNVNASRLGYGRNFMQTARRCSSDWIAFCDQDDIWQPNKIERCAREIRDGITLIAHSAAVMGQGRLPDWPARPVNPPLSLPPRWMCLGFCQVFDRRLLQLPQHRLIWVAVEDAHDVWIPFVAGMSGTIVWIDEPLATYRQHEGNVSSTLPDIEGDDIRYAEAASAIAAELGFAHAADYYARYATRLRDRAAVREKHSLRSFVRLLFSGAYRGGGYERFGKRGFIEDARALLS